MPDLNTRIERMFFRDRLAAGAFVIALWLVIGFVFLQIRPLAGRAISAVLVVAAGLVAVFNTASITAMIRHYRHEKARIYGLDINDGAHLNTDRVHTYIVDQGSREELRAFLEKCPDKEFDIILDDGSHRADHQQVSLEVVDQRLPATGGLDLVEDADRTCAGGQPARIGEGDLDNRA